MNQIGHLIFFTQLYYPDITTTAIIMTDLTEDLASYGLNVKVICAQPTYLVKKSCPKDEVHNKVVIRRVWTFLFDKNKILGRLLNGISCFFAMLITLFSIEKKAILVFNTNPALLPLLGFIGKKLRNRQYVILVHDLWPELPVHTGMIRKGGLLYKIIDFINIQSFKNANGIIAISDKMKERILYKVPEKEHSIYIIHNWADANRIFPIEKENIRLFDGLGLRNKKIIVYSGNLGLYQPLEVMIGAANELKDREDILFLFVGNGGKKVKIQNLAESLELDNIKFLPFQPLDRLSEFLSLADVSLMGIYPENEGVIMPSKLYSLLAIGKPIICVADPESEVAKILEQAKAGIQSSVIDPKELASKILGIIDNQEKAIAMGKNGRKYFLEHFERKIITRQWNSILNKLTSN
jgi:putative colanic acid biosynthesis glycosyltransferase WcaI